MKKEYDEPIFIDINDFPLSISKVSYDRIYKLKNYKDAIAIYLRYCSIAFWRHKITIYATTEFMAKGCQMSASSVRRAKKELIALGLIEDVVIKNKKNSLIIGHYIKVNYISVKNEKVHPNKNTQCGDLLGNNNSTEELNNNTERKRDMNEPKIVRKRRSIDTNQVLLDQIKELTEQNQELSTKLKKYEEPIQKELFEVEKVITINDFDTFYELYPKKIAKGIAREKWNKACNSKTLKNSRPTLEKVLQSLKDHKESKQWQNHDYIPNPSNWIKGEQWNDKLDKMNNSVKVQPNGKPKSFGYVGKEIEYTKPIKM